MNRRNRYRPRYRGIVAVAALLGFDAVMPVALAAPSEIRIPGERTFPESITAAADGTIYIGSMGEGGIFRAAPGSETAQPWIAPGTNGMMSVVGVFADDAANTLWACSSDLSDLGITIPGGQKQVALKGFDLKTGAPTASVPFTAAKSFCNDIAKGKDGALYVTNTMTPQILRLKPGAKQFEVWIENPAFGTEGPGLDGIAFGSDGQVYVNTYGSGKLFRVAVKADGSAGAITPLTPSQPLDRPDALRLAGDNNIFLMVEGGGRLDQVTVSQDTAKIEVLKDGFKLPVSVIQVGGIAWTLEGQLNLLFDPAKRGIKPDPFRAVAVPYTVK